MEEEKESWNLGELLQKSKSKVDQISKQVERELKEGLDKTSESMETMSERMKTSLKTAASSASSSWDSLREQLRKHSVSFQENSREFITETGRKIKLHSKALGTTAVGTVLGASIASMLFNVDLDRDKNQFDQERNVIQEYGKIVTENPEIMNMEHWRAYIANLSAQLETQLRFRLHALEPELSLFDLLLIAEDSSIYTSEELARLHDFRFLRNRVIHMADQVNVDKNLVFWVHKQVDMMDEKLTDEVPEE